MRQLGYAAALVYRIASSRLSSSIAAAPALSKLRRFSSSTQLPSRAAATMDNEYSSWSREQLVSRVAELEKQLESQTRGAGSTSSNPPPSKKRKPNRAFDSSKYSTRFIALKLAYLGGAYNGFEGHANNVTTLPSIEDVLWRALMKTRLIAPTPARDRHGRVLGEGELNWEGCEYSKCGRTDKGVSAFGQVIALRVRSKRPLPSAAEEDGTLREGNESSSFDPVRDELPYPQILNGVLPPDIRIIAWCPTPPPDFSARFSCRGRQYRYFFTQPAFLPTPGAGGVYRDVGGRTRREGWLDVDRMREAARLLEGEHDFRNFCKIEPSKQMTSFTRCVYSATVEEVDSLDVPRTPSQTMLNDAGLLSLQNPPQAGGMKMCCLQIHGSAFLWHQVRNIAAILFLVGQGLEPPSIVADLLDLSKYPSKPHYTMADDTPLVLWNCNFPDQNADPVTAEDRLDWVYANDPRNAVSEQAVAHGMSDGKYGRKSLMENLWSVWRQRKIDEVLAAGVLDVVARTPDGRTYEAEMSSDSISPSKWISLLVTLVESTDRIRTCVIYSGGDTAKPGGDYVPIARRVRSDPVHVLNAAWKAKNDKKQPTASDHGVD